MGVYPEQRTIPTNTQNVSTWTEEVHSPGLIRRRTVTAGEWTEERTDCFCCSCGDLGGTDAYCRNHGWAARRPCELHRMPGTPDEDGFMPASVQTHRNRQTAVK